MVGKIWIPKAEHKIRLSI